MRSIYTANSFTDLITLIQNSRRQGTGRFSYRQLANKLGYRSPRTIAMIHKGQRRPNHNLVQRIINHFAFSPHEIELTLLFVEKALGEKSKIPADELELRIEKLKQYLKDNENPKPHHVCSVCGSESDK